MGIGFVHTICGIGLGWLIAFLVYKRNLHWHWTRGVLLVLVALIVTGQGLVISPLLSDVFLASQLLGAWGLLVAALVATAMGRGWHRQNEKMGGDLARMAEDRISPSDAVQAFGLRWTLRHNESPKSGTQTKSSTLLLGVDDKGCPLYIPNGNVEGEHVVIVGAPGEGKTVTQTAIAVSRILMGHGAVVLEGKSDDFMLEQVLRAARKMGKKVIVWTPNGPISGEQAWVYDLLADGNYTELTDRLIADKKWESESEFHKDAAQLYLLRVTKVLERRGTRVTLPEVINYCHPNALIKLLTPKEKTDGESDDDIGPNGPEPEAQPRVLQDQGSLMEESKILRNLLGMSEKAKDDVASTIGRLAITVEADIGRWLDPNTPNTKTFGLREAIKDGAVVYFRLEADARRNISKRLTSAIIEDLGASTNALQGKNANLVVILDEFQAVPTENVNNLTARGRAAGITLVLGTQEIRADVEDELRDQLINSAKVVIAHCQRVLESATYLAEQAGYKWVWRVR